MLLLGILLLIILGKSNNNIPYAYLETPIKTDGDIIIYFSLNCPHCREFYIHQVKSLPPEKSQAIDFRLILSGLDDNYLKEAFYALYFSESDPIKRNKLLVKFLDHYWLNSSIKINHKAGNQDISKLKSVFLTDEKRLLIHTTPTLIGKQGHILFNSRFYNNHQMLISDTINMTFQNN